MEEKTKLLWTKAIEDAKSLVSEHFIEFMSKVKLSSFEDNTLTVEVPSQSYVETIENTYIDGLAPALRNVFGEDIKLMYSYQIL